MSAWAAPGIDKEEKEQRREAMSAMGELADRAREAVARLQEEGCNGASCAPAPLLEDLPAASTQSEVSIAVDSTGQHVVVGFNDFRGFFTNPTSVSGFMYSDDGGLTWTDGGQLPSPGTDVVGGVRLPQIYGDPEVKYLGGCTFLYASILMAKYTATTTVQTMGIHRSTDCGHTWQGPFEVTGATNPWGGVTSSGAPRDAADKEFVDVDPDTGRVLMSWTNFTPFAAGGNEIRITYSDDVATATPPTWSTSTIISGGLRGNQGSIPRFAGKGGDEVYVAWRRGSGYTNTVTLARSLDNGVTWQAPRDIAGPFFTIDQILGNDRVSTSPWLAVDNSGGPRTGWVYVNYSNNDLTDGADIYFQRSTDKGVTFSTPVPINARPGQDRAQWFPANAVDTTTGRLHVYYYDQGVVGSGDLTEVSYVWSDDGGGSWSPQMPISDRPFRAGWGNDTSQPNLGDYNGAVAQGGDFFAAFSITARPPGGFQDGLPGSTAFTVPDVTMRRVPELKHKVKASTVLLRAVQVADANASGGLDAAERATLTVTLENFVTNPLSARTVTGVTAQLSSETAGVSIISGQSPFPNLAPGAQATNVIPYVIETAATFVPGTPIELVLDVRSAEHGQHVLRHTLFTGTPVKTTLMTEDFEDDFLFPACPNGSGIPTGWCSLHAGGVNTVPWLAAQDGFCGNAGRAAFHANANDGPSANAHTRFERLLGPSIEIPAETEWVELEFDVCYDTEEDGDLAVQAYDGLVLRVTHFSGPALTGIVRSVLLEAFADDFTTGAIFHYPKHLPRNSSSAYFQDMSAWAGFSNGVQRVRARLPGMAGTWAQLRFEYTQDSNTICSDLRPGNTCGVQVDNIVVRAVKSAH